MSKETFQFIFTRLRILMPKEKPREKNCVQEAIYNYQESL